MLSIKRYSRVYRWNLCEYYRILFNNAPALLSPDLPVSLWYDMVHVTLHMHQLSSKWWVLPLYNLHWSMLTAVNEHTMDVSFLMFSFHLVLLWCFITTLICERKFSKYYPIKLSLVVPHHQQFSTAFPIGYIWCNHLSD